MNPLEVNKSNQVLYKQRNILLIISTAMIASNILFGIVALSKSERIVIMPHLKEQVSITGGSEFSESYIDQMTFFYVDMLLNVTPDNPCPSGEVNRVVQGVNIYPYESN